jgi:hypothetical protein
MAAQDVDLSQQGQSRCQSQQLVLPLLPLLLLLLLLLL